MAYRADQRRDLCAACGELADVPCARCTGPLCSSHTPVASRRCDACEAGYLIRETRVVKNVIVACVAIAALVGLAGAIGTHLVRNGFLKGTAMHAVPLIPSVAVFLFCLIFASPPAIKHLLRARFLRERPRSG